MKTGKTSHKDKLIKRLRYLWTFELFDSFFIPLCILSIARTLGQTIGVYPLYSLIILSVILWQGTAYWLLKLRAVKTNSPVKDKHLRWFAVFKYSNWGLLAMLPLILWIAYRPYGRLVIGFDLIVGSLLYIMDILEQVNYYYYQLMYDCPADWRYLATYKRLKKSNLSRALSKYPSS